MTLRRWMPVLAVLSSVSAAALAQAQTPPPAPVPVAPANGASLVQPITLQWQPVVDPDGPIGSYSWEVATSSTFGTVIASGFNNFDLDVPLPTTAQVSGLTNGTYFWRVKAAQDQGPAGFFDSPWSATRSFTVTGLGPAPGTPTITSPAMGAQFHPVEFFDIVWTEVPGAVYYLLEADDDSGFSHPITLGSTKVFGTTFEAGWGNEIPNAFYRVRAVSADNVRGLPSATLTTHITNAAPVPPPPTPLSPVGGANITIPFNFDWTDTANPQIVGYDIDIDDDPAFAGDFGIMMILQISRSNYMVVGDPLVEGINHLPPGTYFWRVRAVHGNVSGPWSAGASFHVVASPPTPAGLEIFWILADPGTVAGGNPTAARIALNKPAPAGGALINLTSDFPGIDIASTVLIPAGATDAVVAPVTSPPVSADAVSTLRAEYGGKWQQSSIGASPILWGGSLNAERVVAGTTVTGSVTLVGPAPPGGIDVSLLSSNTAVAQLPPSVFIPEGATGASFSVTTSPVSVPTRVVFDFGAPFENSHSPTTWLVVNPAGSPAAPSAVSTVTLTPATLVGGSSGTGTVTLTAPAPSGGKVIRLNGSDDGSAVVPAQVTVPAGGTSVNFSVNPGKVARSHWAIVQAWEFPNGLLHATTLRVDPGGSAPSELLTVGVSPSSVIGGGTLTGTVGLSVPASAGGQAVALTSSDPSVTQVPASVMVPAGHSTASFTVTTSVVTAFSPVFITGTAGGVSKDAFFSVIPDPNPQATLASISLNPASVVGGSPSTGTATLTSAAPAGGRVVTLSSGNPSVATVPPSVTVPANATSATFTVSTVVVAATTTVTINGSAGGANRSATLTVSPAAPPGFRGPTANAADTGGDGNGFEVGAANAQTQGGAVAVDNNSGTAGATTCTSTARDRHRFFNYGLSVPAGTSVAGIEVRVDARADGTSGAPKMCVELSWDGGTTWTAAKSTPTLTTVLATYVLGGTADTWGRAWTPAQVSNANFRVRVTDVANSTARDFSLDWIAVRVTAGTAPPTATPTRTPTRTPTSAQPPPSTPTRTPTSAQPPPPTPTRTPTPAAPTLDLTLSGVPSSIARGQFFNATGSVANTGGGSASGYTVVVAFTPSSSMRAENPRSTSQSLPTVPAGGSSSVTWQIRADNAGSATLTMTLRNSGGTTVDTASKTLTITD